MKKIGFVFYLVAIFFWACSPKPKPEENHTNDTNQIHTITKPDSATLMKPKIMGQMRAYYTSLEQEKIDENQFFAHVVTVFYNSKDISSAKIGESLREGFKKMDNRKITIDEQATSLKITPDGYELILGGTSTHTDVTKKNTVEGVFRNKIILDKDLKITYYNVAPDAERIAGEQNELIFAQQLVAAFGKSETLANFIHPDKGVVCMYRSGAFDRMETRRTTEEIKVKNKAVWKVLASANCSDIILNKIPAFNCETEFKEKGCFLAPVSQFDEAARTATELNKLNDRSVGYNEKQKDSFKEIEGMITHQLIITDSNLLLGFGQIEGKWYLLEINISKFDCSA